MDYSKIVADESVGTSIGRLYVKAKSDPSSRLVRECYGRFMDQVTDQYREMVKSVKVEFTYGQGDPYPDAFVMFDDIRRGRLLIRGTTESERHPLMGIRENDMFRAVHDYYGHFGAQRGFDRHGEEAAWLCHSKMFTGLARRAMTTETRGQSSALCWVLGEFPEQKATILPEWVSEIPLKYLV